MLRPSANTTTGEGQSEPATANRWWSAPLRVLREFGRFCRRERTWVVAMSLFVLVWTLELYIVQSVTLVYPNEGGARFTFWAPKIRLVLDVLFIATLTIWFRRRLLVACVIASFFAFVVLVTYHDYFFRPLSLLTIMSNWREGLQVGGFARDMFPKFACLALAGALAVKLAALYFSRGAALPRSCAWLVGVVLAVTCVSLEAATNLVDPLYKIQTKRNVGRLGVIRGYLVPWAAEWYFVGDSERLKQALERRHAPLQSPDAHRGRHSDSRSARDPASRELRLQHPGV